MCRNCGALVGANETNCSLCGAPKDSAGAVQPQAPPHVADHETMRFARAIMTRPYIFTLVFLVANFLVFLLMWSSSGLTNATLLQPSSQVLIAYGAKLNFLVNHYHQWWRFVTPVFIHIGVLHLLVNMYGLWMFGPYVERLYGSAKFVVLWVVTGIVGVLASYLSVRPEMTTSAVGRFLFRPGDGPSAGASGALFGLVGALFVFGIKYRRELPEGFKRAFGTGLLPVILMNLYIGYLGRGFIDNAAHLGGLLSGALFALVIGYKRPGESAKVAIFWHVLQALALALVAISFLMVARNFNNQYPELADVVPPAALVNNSDLTAYLDALNGGQKTFRDALFKDDSGGIDEAVKKLEESKPPDKTAAALRDELKSLLVRARDFLTKPLPKRTKQQTIVQKNELFAALEEWGKKRDQWVNNEGKNYGIYIDSSPASDSTKEK
jgi:membrane associated rhomboid family serine protease